MDTFIPDFYQLLSSSFARYDWNTIPFYNVRIIPCVKLENITLPHKREICVQLVSSAEAYIHVVHVVCMYCVWQVGESAVQPRTHSTRAVPWPWQRQPGPHVWLADGAQAAARQTGQCPHQATLKNKTCRYNTYTRSILLCLQPVGATVVVVVVVVVNVVHTSRPPAQFVIYI